MQIKRKLKKDVFEIAVFQDDYGQVTGVRLSPVYEDVIVEPLRKKLLSSWYFWLSLFLLIALSVELYIEKDKLPIIAATTGIIMQFKILLNFIKAKANE